MNVEKVKEILSGVFLNNAVGRNIFEIVGEEADYIRKDEFEITNDITESLWYAVSHDDKVVGFITYDPTLIEQIKEYNPSARKFYKKVIQVTILSETKDIPTDLSDVAYQIAEGDMNGNIEEIEDREIGSIEVADLLLESHSDPGFFMLDEYGEDC